MLFIELEKPSLVSFIGAPRTEDNKTGRLTLSPGENEVPDDIFHAVWKADPLIKSYYEAGHFKIYDDDDKDFVPSGAERPGRRSRRVQAERKPAYEGPKVHPSQLMGTENKAPTSELKSPSELPEPEPEPARAESIEPTKMGGGVPGDVHAARAAVTAEGDVGQLKSWRDEETRNQVIKVLDKRIKTLESGD